MGSQSASVVLHMDDFEDINELKDSDAGKLLKAIIAYSNDGSMPEKLGIQAKTMFSFIRRHIDRDKLKYEETCRRRSESGRKGGRPKKQEGDNPDGFSEKQKEAKKANGFSEKQKNPDTDPEPDTDPDTDPEPDTDPDTDPEPDTDTDSQSMCEKENAGEKIEKQKAARIRLLETYMKLFQSGALDDPEEYKRYREELRILKGGSKNGNIVG